MQKVDIKAESKIGSLDNVKHKPGGGDKKIFNDRDYLRQTSSNVESVNGSGSQVCFVAKVKVLRIISSRKFVYFSFKNFCTAESLACSFAEDEKFASLIILF